MEDFSNVISSFVAVKANKEYLCAECNYGNMGVDDAVFAQRTIGDKDWLLPKDKRPCASLFIFGNDYPKQIPFPKEDFLKIMQSLYLKE